MLRGLGKFAHDLAESELARRSGNRLQSFEENCLPETLRFLLLANRLGIEHVDRVAGCEGEDLIDHEPVIKLIVISLDVP